MSLLFVSLSLIEGAYQFLYVWFPLSILFQIIFSTQETMAFASVSRILPQKTLITLGYRLITDPHWFQ